MNNAFTRSILYWVLFIGLLYITGSLANLVPTGSAKLIQGGLSVICAFFITWLFLKYEKKHFKDIGLTWEKATLTRFLLGILIGAAIFACMLMLLLNFTALQLQKNPGSIQFSTLVKYSVIFILLALMEEVAFRSYAFLKLNKSYGIWIAQLVTALAFALYHVVIGWDIYIAFLGPGTWAFVFGYAAIRSGGIAMPTGIHAVINFLQVLTGMKGDDASIWVLHYKEGSTESPAISEGTLGLIIQLMILAGAIILTALLNRKKAGTV